MNLNSGQESDRAAQDNYNQQPGVNDTGARGTPAAPRAATHAQRSAAEADAALESLYAKRIKIYPREVHGRYNTLRVFFLALTLGLFYGLPWINWGEGRQAFLIDLPARKFNLFFWTFYPQDLFYLTAILIISALSLFLFTAVLGRVWCGFTCPQTVWTEAFLWIERKIEGDRMKQMKLTQSPWTGEKILKRSTKHFIWLAFALWTGFTFVGFFTPIRELADEVAHLALGPWETFWILFYGFATYGNAGWLREQVCIYMCPYARFQSSMFDKDTLIISYDQARGEPRGSRKRGDDYRADGKGDCIDCTLCVQVCPTGIDIRDGLQHECIACAACVDACNSVMDKVGYPRGLIRYTTAHALTGEKTKIFRPRVLVYSVILGAIALALVVAVLLRVPLELDVIRDRGAMSLYRETNEGWIENVYSLKIINMDNSGHVFDLTAEGIPDVKLALDTREIRLGPGEITEVAARLQANPDSLKSRSTKVRFKLQARDNSRIVQIEDGVFLGPIPAR